jgi:hypothetical protein
MRHFTPLGLALLMIGGCRAQAAAPAAKTQAPLAHQPAPTLLAPVGRLWAGTVGLPKAMWQHKVLSLSLLGATGALMAFADHPIADQVQGIDSEHDAKTASNYFLLAVEPAEGVADSLILHKDHNPWKTMFSAALTVGYMSAGSEALKLAAGRERPYLLHDGDGGFFQGGASFPSGHALASFTIASFLAHRYPRHRWVAWIGYGLAGTVAVLRVLAKEHFPSDVFAGGVLGTLGGACGLNCQ